MDKGDYLNIMIMNQMTGSKSVSHWENTFDKELPPSFGSMKSIEAKLYNKNLLLKQFPESHRVVPVSSSKSTNATTKFSPKKEYYNHVKEESKKGKANHHSVDLPSAPAWSLAAREFPPDIQRPWKRVGDYEISKAALFLSTKKTSPAYSLGIRFGNK